MQEKAKFFFFSFSFEGRKNKEVESIIQPSRPEII